MFNAYNAEDLESNLPPSGTYNVMCFNTEAKTFKTGTQGLSVSFKILDGSHANETIFANFFPYSDNGFVKRKYALLLQACGIPPKQPWGAHDIDNKMLNIKVTLKGENHEINEILSYGQGNVAPVQAYSAPPAYTPPAPPAYTPPAPPAYTPPAPPAVPAPKTPPGFGA